MSLDDYPYLATWCDTIEEADAIHEGVFPPTMWMPWNGIAAIAPTFVRYQGKTYTYEEFKKEVWNF